MQEDYPYKTNQTESFAEGPTDVKKKGTSSKVSESRRSFLLKSPFATYGSAALAAGLGFGSITEADAKNRKRRRRRRRRRRRAAAIAALPYNRRMAEARQVRFEAARQQTALPDPGNMPNGDEENFSNYIGNFTKTLPHDDNLASTTFGEVDTAAYESLLDALDSSDDAVWEAVPLAPGATRKLANPRASKAYSLSGADSHSLFMPKAPAFNSAETAAEIGEVYLHALLRDIPFEEYENPSDMNTADAVSFAVDELNKFSNFTGPKDGGLVTPGTLFRGSFDGDLAGNYISQFLLIDVPQGAALTQQLYETTVPGDDHMTNQSDWINILKGGSPVSSPTFDPQRRHIFDARSLAEYVHRDYTYQTYLQAALILLGGGFSTNPTNPYNTSSTQGGFVTFGGAEILSLVAEVGLNALKAAWYQKWQVHRRVRPEVYAGWIHLEKNESRGYDISSEILNSMILDAIAMNNAPDEYWLPMAYPEGSPTHPAYPAGHAAIAGACVTVLKAFFDESETIANPVQVKLTADALNATELESYSGGDILTVGGELNKLANNIAIGRNMAGVHWRSDGTEGVLLGEQVAISLLKDYKLTYNENFGDFQFTSFEGDAVTI